MNCDQIIKGFRSWAAGSGEPSKVVGKVKDVNRLWFRKFSSAPFHHRLCIFHRLCTRENFVFNSLVSC